MFFYIAEQCPLVGIGQLFTHWPVEGRTHCFHLLAVINGVAVNSGVQVSVRVDFSNVDAQTWMFNFTRHCQTVFQSCRTVPHSRWQQLRPCGFPSLSALAVVGFFKSRSHRRTVLSHCGLISFQVYSRMSDEVECLFLCLFPIRISSWVKHVFWSCTRCFKLLVFFPWNLELYFTCRASVSCVFCKYFPRSLASLFLFLTASSAEQRFKMLINHLFPLPELALMS